MPKFYNVEPEVAGGLGSQTLLDSTVHPPVVSRLHFEFQGWLGDQILETFPVFLVTTELSNRFCEMNLSGFLLDSALISQSDEFKAHSLSAQVPVFLWLKIVGDAGIDDFGIGEDNRLVTSERALKAILTTNPRALHVEKFLER